MKRSRKTDLKFTQRQVRFMVMLLANYPAQVPDRAREGWETTQVQLIKKFASIDRRGGRAIA